MGCSPQPSSRYCVPPFPVRRGFIMTRRSRCVHHPALPSCSHRLRISLFFSSTCSSFPCAFEWQFSYKHGWICAQLPLSVPQFHLRRYLSNIYFHHSFIVSDPVLSRRLALFFHAFDWHLATSPAGYAPSCHFPFHHSSSAYFYDIILPQRNLDNDIVRINRRVPPAMLLADQFLSLFHPGNLPSSLPLVHQRPISFSCFR